MKKIPLTKGKFSIVDDEDYDFLMQWKWCCSVTGYAVRGIGPTKDRKIIFMHRILGQIPDGMQGDHVDGDKLNNQKLNIRAATNAQNQGNRKPIGGSSRFKGVCWDKNRQLWHCSIRVNYKQKNLGRFSSEIDAARTYNAAALQHFGEFAKVNPC